MTSDRPYRKALPAEKMLAEHDAKLKREQKLVKKWRQKVRYYGRVFEQRKAADKA